MVRRIPHARATSKDAARADVDVHLGGYIPHARATLKDFRFEVIVVGHLSHPAQAGYVEGITPRGWVPERSVTSRTRGLR